MNFTVLWSPEAEGELAEVWLNAEDRQAIVAATATIDARLKSNPKCFGESRSGNARIAFVRPLGVDFEVLSDDRLVYDLSVWQIDRR